jgi:DNA-binding SARP family transcriptional activator
MLRDETKRLGVRLDLQLLGWWELHVADTPVLLGHREQRLVALLALRGSRTRSHVAGTLWPDATEERALSSLRSAVLRTRRAVDGLLEVGRGTLSLGREVHVDVQDLCDCAAALMDRPVGDSQRVMSTLTSADLLPGWYEDWVLFERERLQHLRLRSLEALALNALDRGCPEDAVAAAQAAVAIEPLRESAHAIAIRAHLVEGNRAAALRQFQGYRARLARELGVAPSPEIVALVSRLGARRSDG